MKREEEAYRYLMTLLLLRGKRPDGRVSLQEVAAQHGVHRSTVMRSLLLYREQELLDEHYALTEKGQRWITSEGKKIRRIADFLKQNQVQELQALEDARRIVESCSEESAMLLSNMIYRCGHCPQKQKVHDVQWHGASGEELLQRLHEIVRQEAWPAAVFFRRERGEAVHEMSMASEAFDRTAVLALTPGEEHLRLRCRTMTQQSIVGRWFEGMAANLFCEEDGSWRPLEIACGEVRVPLRSFWISYRSDGTRIRGIARLRMGCSAGSDAMGMQTAILEFRVYVNAGVYTS